MDLTTFPGKYLTRYNVSVDTHIGEKKLISAIILKNQTCEGMVPETLIHTKENQLNTPTPSIFPAWYKL